MRNPILLHRLANVAIVFATGNEEHIIIIVIIRTPVVTPSFSQETASAGSVAVVIPARVLVGHKQRLPSVI